MPLSLRLLRRSVFGIIHPPILGQTLVIHVLTNETFTGTCYFGKTHMVDDGQRRVPRNKRGMGKQVTRAKEEWIPIQVPAIIDPQTFTCAQKLKAYKQKVLKGYTKNR